MALSSSQRGFCLGLGLVTFLACVVQLPLRELNTSLYHFLAFLLGLGALGYMGSYIWQNILCDPPTPAPVLYVAGPSPPPQIIRETVPTSRWQQFFQLCTFCLSVTQTCQLSTIFDMLNTARRTVSRIVDRALPLLLVEQARLQAPNSSRRRRNKKRKTVTASPAPPVPCPPVSCPPPVSSSACPTAPVQNPPGGERKDNAQVVGTEAKVNA